MKIKHRITGEVILKIEATCGADLSGADLRDVNLRGADLRDSNLSGAYLSYANLRYANLYGADLRDVNLRGANLRYANLYGADLRDVNLRGADLGYANLRGADLRGADLGYANLRGADLRDSNLSGADLSGANISSTIGIDPAETNAGKQNRDLFPFCVDGEWRLSLGCFTGSENQCILAIREKYGEGSEYERKVKSAFQKAYNGELSYYK